MADAVELQGQRIDGAERIKIEQAVIERRDQRVGDLGVGTRRVDHHEISHAVRPDAEPPFSLPTTRTWAERASAQALSASLAEPAIPPPICIADRLRRPTADETNP
jgi:hypothetical protein